MGCFPLYIGSNICIFNLGKASMTVFTRNILVTYVKENSGYSTLVPLHISEKKLHNQIILKFWKQ